MKENEVDIEHLIKDIEKPALPMFISNWIFGIGIIEYPIGKPRVTFSLVYTFLILIIYCSLAAYAYPFVISMSNEFEVNNKLMSNMFWLSVSLTMFTTILGRYRSKGMHTIIKQMALADYLLEKIGIPRNYNRVFKSQLGKVMGFFVFVLGVVVINSINMFTKSNLDASQIIAVFIINYPIIIMFLVDSTFINFIGYAHSDIRKLNSMLKEQLTCTTECPQHKRVIQNHLNDEENSKIGDTENSIIMDKKYIIKTAKQALLQVMIACKETDCTYGLHILLSLIIAIAIITGIIFHVYCVIVYMNLPQDKLYRVLASGCTWLLYYIIKICILSTQCSAISEEYVKAGDIVSQFYDEPSITKDTQDEIREFLIQLIENSFKFTVFGFITLDLSLMHVVVSSVTTYVVILIQLGNFVK